MTDAYEATTRGILVRATPQYLPTQSDPARGRFTWAYTMQIENRGGETVQLLSRHWIITDARGHTEHVKGDGVVGEQPTLRPAEAYRYTSGTALETPTGAMRGTYRLITDLGETFDVEIPEFSLHTPDALRRMN